MAVTITHEGHPAIVMMSVEEFEGWMETLEIMSDPELVKDIRTARHEKETIPLEELEQWVHTTRNVRRRSQANGRKTVRKTARKGPAKNSRRHSRAA